MGRRIFFTEKGINILEQILIEEFLINPKELEKATKVLDLELIPIIQKHLKRYLQIQEDLSRIRAGATPKYHSMEYYTKKPIRTK